MRQSPPFVTISIDALQDHDTWGGWVDSDVLKLPDTSLRFDVVAEAVNVFWKLADELSELKDFFLELGELVAQADLDRVRTKPCQFHNALARIRSVLAVRCLLFLPEVHITAGRTRREGNEDEEMLEQQILILRETNLFAPPRDPPQAYSNGRHVWLRTVLLFMP